MAEIIQEEKGKGEKNAQRKAIPIWI